MNKPKKSVVFITILITVLVSVAIVIFAINFDGFNKKPGNLISNDNNSPTPAPTPVASIEPTPEATPEATPVVTPTPTPTQRPTPKPASEPELVKVKGLYLTPGTVGYPSKVKHYVELANNTEINAYVIDIKYDTGTICYETNVELAKKYNAIEKRYDVNYVINEFHKNNIRVIGRIVCFNDATMAINNPDFAIKKSDGSVFKISTNGGKSYLAWLNPTNKETWNYISDIAEEAIKLGFDEIQLDYVRFPETTLYKYDLGNIELERSEYIDGFLEHMRKRLPGIVISADIFGNVCLASKDNGQIGQTLETVGKDIHYISPMIYPSHFASDRDNGVGSIINGVKFTIPDLDPYGVIYNTLAVTKKRIDAVKGYDIRVRPYLQGFTASYLKEGYYQEYTKEQYEQQIQAVYDAGFEEWLFWNSKNIYAEEAFK